MIVSASHLLDLRRAVNAVRVASGLSEANFTGAISAGATLISAVHVAQLRTSVAEARAAAGLSAVSFTDATLTGLSVKALHLQELMNAF